MSNSEMASPSMCAAMPSIAPTVTTPVPPMPAIIMLKLWLPNGARSGSGSWRNVSSSTKSPLGLRGSAPWIVMNDGQNPFTQL